MKEKNKAKKLHCNCSLLPHVLVSVIIFGVACVSLVAVIILHNLKLDFTSSIFATKPSSRRCRYDQDNQERYSVQELRRGY